MPASIQHVPLLSRQLLGAWHDAALWLAMCAYLRDTPKGHLFCSHLQEMWPFGVSLRTHTQFDEVDGVLCGGQDESLGTREEIKGVAPKSSPCEGHPELVVQQK